MLHSKEELAEELVTLVGKEAMFRLLTNYDSGKTIAEIDAEGVLQTLRAQTVDVADEFRGAKSQLRVAILEFLEVLGA